LLGNKGIAGLPPEVLGPRGRYLTLIIIIVTIIIIIMIIMIIITFTRERPEGFRHASPMPVRGLPQAGVALQSL
jgi:hypothetical protein